MRWVSQLHFVKAVLRRFISECVQLPYGETLAFSIAGVVRHMAGYYACVDVCQAGVIEMWMLADVLDAFYRKFGQAHEDVQIDVPSVEIEDDNPLILEVPSNSPEST
jgi:hypothetical protein